MRGSGLPTHMCMSNAKKLSLLLSGVAVTYKDGRHIGVERFFYIGWGENNEMT